MAQPKVLKFGGTSMGTAEAMKKSAAVCVNQKADFVVVSAVSGTTDQLIQLSKVSVLEDTNLRQELLEKIKTKHQNLAAALSISATEVKKLETLFEEIKSLTDGIFLLHECSIKSLDRLLSLGERMSSVIFTEVLQAAHTAAKTSKKIQWLDARTLLKTDNHFGKAKPSLKDTIKSISEKCDFKQNFVYLTQGFIGETMEGETTTLGRGGSDFSAAFFAECIGASVCEIWTDVPGIATTDPRIDSEARTIPEISFQEASELATFGAKVLHPLTLLPAIRQNIPVYVANTFAPEKGGTWVRFSSSHMPLIRAVAVRKNQSLVTLTAPEMLQAHGFLFQIFKIFNDYKISVDAITTSEISVSMTVDDATLEQTQFIEALKEFAEVTIESGFSLVSLIGNNINHTAGIAGKIFSVIPEINIRLICLGASKHNFCFLVENKFGEECVKKLHQKLIIRSEIS